MQTRLHVSEYLIRDTALTRLSTRDRRRLGCRTIYPVSSKVLDTITKIRVAIGHLRGHNRRVQYIRLLFRGSTRGYVNMNAALGRFTQLIALQLDKGH
jgi:hypothetical protein